MGGACSAREMRNAQTTQFLVGKAEGKRPLGRCSGRERILSKWILGKLSWRV
jgi:hypothetical protein